MKLIFIYGPPAVGKFTVAKKLEDPFAAVEGMKSLSLDVGEMTAEQAARAIVKKYGLG